MEETKKWTTYKELEALTGQRMKSAGEAVGGDCRSYAQN